MQESISMPSGCHRESANLVANLEAPGFERGPRSELGQRRAVPSAETETYNPLTSQGKILPGSATDAVSR